VNADTEFNPQVLSHIGILPGHDTLNFHCAAGSVHGACELDQHAVSGGFNDTAAMFGDGRIDKHFPERLELRQRTFFVAAHQTGDIRR
jgi:hypothetical protein